MKKIAIVVSEGIKINEYTTVLYDIYRVSIQDINTVIKNALNDGCTSILAFVENKKQEAMIATDQAVTTFVTACNSTTATFFVKQAEMLIKAKMNLEDICLSLSQSLRNYSIR